MIIVTGGAGFIGSNIVKGLNDQYVEIQEYPGPQGHGLLR